MRDDERLVRVTHVSFDGCEARAIVDIDHQSREIFIRTSRRIPEPKSWGDIWAPFGMFPAMRRAESAHFNVPMSRRRRKNLAEAQKVLLRRFPQDFSPSRLLAPTSLRRRRRARKDGIRKVAQFFTGGIDSFYTMMTNPDVSVLVYAYDLVNEPPRITALLRRHLRDIADYYDKELIEIEYNARIALDDFADWGQQSYTGVLSSFASLLAE